MLHLPSTALYSRVYVWIPIGLYLFERTLRTLRYAYNNIRPGRATLIHLPGGVTKVVVRTRQLKCWNPGSFVLLSLPRFGLGQSHPATIASIPSSHEGNLVFVLRAHRGFTSRIHANASVVSLHEGSPDLQPQGFKTAHLVLIDGPYGGKHLDFAFFVSVLLIAGSTGVTFTPPILLDIAARSPKWKLPVREVTFIWAIKTSACTSWINSELKNASEEIQKAGIKFSVRIFVTADEEYVEVEEGRQSSPAKCSCSGECSCVVPIADAAKISPITEAGKTAEAIESPSAGKGEGAEKPAKAKLPVYSDAISSVTTMQVGRPDLRSVISEKHGIVETESELGIAVCGPVGLTAETRRVVAGLQGRGQGIYLHAESFGW